MGLTEYYINLRGLENFMCDFLTEPEAIHQTMRMLCDGALGLLDFLEENQLLAYNSEGTYVGAGGFGYTDFLPSWSGGKVNVTAMDMWGFVESQETVAINPELYGEFIYPYHEEIAKRFGLNCYGCCEPYDPRWKYVKKLTRLRKVSCSPWSDWSTIKPNLGKDYIASIKPTPTSLATAHMDEDFVRKELRRALICSEGCIPEIIMKDNHTLGHCPKNASRWVELAREEISRF